MGIAAVLKRDRVRGGEIVSALLQAEGVRHVFGIIDGTYFGMYSTFAQHGISLITPRHETSAVHMAGAYARSTGQLGVCMASNGPGVANALPGVAVENAEGNRVLLITSCRREGIIYPDRGGTFQYFPQVDVTAPMTKWSCAVPSVERLSEILRRAFRVLWTGRPGVVHVDVPESIMNGKFEIDPAWLRLEGHRGSRERIAAPEEQVRQAVRLIGRAKRPLIHAGSGVIHAGACDELMELAKLIEAPITTSWGARAAVDERVANVVPMQYIDAVNVARCTADLVLVIGSRLGETDWWGKPPYWGQPDRQQLIQADLDGECLGAHRPANLAIQADAKELLTQLIREHRARTPVFDLSARSAFVEGVRTACTVRRKKLDKQLSDRGVPMHPAHVATVCRQTFADDAILVIDGGNTAIWANFYHEVRTPGTLLSTPKMGMLGAGVAQALGAKVAHPTRQVYCIIGDGAMGFHQQEIETAIRNDLPVIYLVLCDKQWGMVKMNQQFALKPVKTLLKKSLSAQETINADLHETRFDDLARAMGAHGERVGDPAGLAGAIQRSLATGRCSVIHVDVDPVKHMWAPNLKTFKDMHEEPAG
ncbi:MAG: thiamine pyrophosphate-binding protein [Polyangiaceae bacterium]|nr:thiamine pyrophosphate-binding protein [Polyangiaceae bacterium]